MNSANCFIIYRWIRNIKDAIATAPKDKGLYNYHLFLFLRYLPQPIMLFPLIFNERGAQCIVGDLDISQYFKIAVCIDRIAIFTGTGELITTKSGEMRKHLLQRATTLMGT